MGTRRIFVAIDLSEDVRREIADHVSGLRTSFPDAPVKWEPAEKFHITMKFFGDTDTRQLERIVDRVERAARSVSPFKLIVKGPGSFRRRESAVLWIGVEESAAKLGRLVQISNILEGNNRGDRRSHPHITIARVKRHDQAGEVIGAHTRSPLEAREFIVNHLTIYESRLLSTGSVYSAVSATALSKD